MTTPREPKFFRPCKGNHFGWEIYSWKSWFINIAFGSVEIHLNRWTIKPGETSYSEWK